MNLYNHARCEQLLDDLERRRGTRVVRVRLERNAEHTYLCSLLEATGLNDRLDGLEGQPAVDAGRSLEDGSEVAVRCSHAAQGHNVLRKAGASPAQTCPQVVGSDSVVHSDDR